MQLSISGDKLITVWCSGRCCTSIYSGLGWILPTRACSIALFLSASKPAGLELPVSTPASWLKCRHKAVYRDMEELCWLMSSVAALLPIPLGSSTDGNFSKKQFPWALLQWNKWLHRKLPRGKGILFLDLSLGSRPRGCSSGFQMSPEKASSHLAILRFIWH